MRKYLELFKDGFDETINEKIKPENLPYVGYSPSEGVVFTVIPDENQSGYQMVDLGLPSGLKWADRNVGAETPQDNGLYFSWGNVDGHAVDENGNTTDGYSFDYSTYPATSGGKYNRNTLDAEHDAATVNMKGEWRMPTSNEYTELVNAVKSSDGTKGILTCQYEYIDLNGEQQSLVVYNDEERSYFSVEGLIVNDSPIFKTILGIRFTNDVTGASIYFPACGYYSSSELSFVGFSGKYWSSSRMDSVVVHSFCFDTDNVKANYPDGPEFGLCVRAVK